MTMEHARLDDKKAPWKKWGPYLSERQWGTVREDYSEGGNAWDYFSHDQARSRAYRWGEDGLAGISDDQQRLCFALALWNGKDPILKERLFGLTNSESNHGEDVKEYYFYLDSTPTHSYMKYLYKYPQAAFPYANLVDTSRGRSRHEFEYELLDTGVFDEDRYFDVFVEYAKESPEDILIQITRPQPRPGGGRAARPADALVSQSVVLARQSRPADAAAGRRAASWSVVKAVDPKLGERYLYCDGDAPLLFTENETNTQRIFGVPNRSPYVKDSINNYIVHGQQDAVNPEQEGHQGRGPLSPDRQARREPGRSAAPQRRGPAAFGRRTARRSARSAQFRRRARRPATRRPTSSTPPSFRSSLNADQANVMRQALAGMLWSKQFYHYDVDKWLEERGSDPFKATRKQAPRNDHWHHMYNGDVISMPDKWEYPWYAAWDLAFHVLALTLVDPDFGKQQLKLMLRERYMHPNGQIPAYEWNFGDVNPPVHAWSTIFTYRLEKAQTGKGDTDWLKSSFQKLLLNFTWWVNRKDRTGRNVFEGGFLGLDNIGVFDRSAPLPTGGYLEQADGTAWMALFCQNMLEIAAELAHDRSGLRGHGAQVRRAFPVDRLVDDAPGRRHRHVGRGGRLLLRRAAAAQRPGPAAQGAVDGRSAAALRGHDFRRGSCWRSTRNSANGCSWFLEARPEVRAAIHDPRKPGVAGRRLASILDETKLRRVLAKMLDENEFLSEFGIRSLSRYHADHPYVIHAGGQEYRVSYLPAESDTGMFGGNSNWRGPIWMPVNAPDHPRLAAVLHLLRQRFHGGMSDRLRPADEPVPGGRGDLAPARRTSSSRTRTAGGRSTAARRSSRKIRTGAISSCSTSTSTATTAPASAPAIRPAGPASSPAPCTCSRPRPPTRCSNSARPPPSWRRSPHWLAES